MARGECELVTLTMSNEPSTVLQASVLQKVHKSCAQAAGLHSSNCERLQMHLDVDVGHEG